VFANTEEILMALEAKEVETLTPIRLRYTGQVLDMTTAYDDQDLTHTEPVEFNKEYISTTSAASSSTTRCRRACRSSRPAQEEGHRPVGELLQPDLGLEITVGMLDRIKSLGFNYATSRACRRP